MDLQEVLKRNVVADHEEVVVALHKPTWDSVRNRGTASTFSSPNKSVSRLAVYSIDRIVDIFKNQISGGRVKIEAYGVITVSTIKEIGLSGDTKIEFEVTEDPIPSNEAHAEIIAFEPGKKAIRKNVARGVGEKLCNKLTITLISPYTPPNAEQAS